MDRTAHEIVQLAREKDRWTSLDFFENIFEGFREFHGDRLFGDDEAVVGGVAKLDGKPVTVIGIQKGRDLQENIRRNFGSPHPEGYRKALRLMKQMSDLKVPIIAIIIGEGGSGGALALGLADEVWMLEQTIYAVLSPEGFASILWKDGSRAAEAAELMKVAATELFDLEVIDRVIPETFNGEPLSKEKVSRMMQKALIEKLTELCQTSVEKLVERRYQRFRKF